MKKTRLIVALIFLAATAFVCYLILRQWSPFDDGKDAGLILGCLWHLACSGGVWFCIDQSIIEAYEERSEYYKGRLQ